MRSKPGPKRLPHRKGGVAPPEEERRLPLEDRESAERSAPLAAPARAPRERPAAARRSPEEGDRGDFCAAGDGAPFAFAGSRRSRQERNSARIPVVIRGAR